MTRGFFDAVRFRTASYVVIALTLAGCANSAATPIVRSTTAAQGAGNAVGATTARITIVVPRTIASNARSRAYVSPATQSLTIGIDGTTPIVVNLTPSSPNCSVPAALDELTCTASITATPGSHNFALVTYDGPNGSGNKLSANTVTASIVANEANTVSVTLAGIPASIQVVPLPSSTGLVGNETAGLSILYDSVQNFNATAIDADGNYIIGPGAPTFTASISGAANGLEVSAATNGDPNEFALNSIHYGNATLALTATPAATSAGSALSISVPVAETTIASTFSGTVGKAGSMDGSATTAQFTAPNGIAYDPANGNFYVTDQGGSESSPVNCSVRQIAPSGAVTTLAGNATCGLKDGTGTAAEFDFPNGIAYDPVTNDLYVADSSGCAIRQVTLAGVVTTIAGSLDNASNGTATCGSVDGPGALAELDLPIGIAYDPSDENLYFTDSTNCEVRQMTSSGTVTTIAGMAPQTAGGIGTVTTNCGYVDGTGTAAHFLNPSGIAVDPVNGDLFVTDTGNCVIRQITSAGVVTTLAGNGPGSAGAGSNCGFADGSGTSAQFNFPLGVTYDTKDGTLYVGDSANCAIRQVTLGGAVTTVAGVPQVCSLVNGPGGQARFNEPSFPVYVASNDSLFLTDYLNSVVRQVEL